MWSMPAPTTMHQRSFSVSEHSPARTRPATRSGITQHARVCSCPATKKESGSSIRGTEESNRITASASAEIEVRTGTVFPGCDSPEHQATGTVPQPNNTWSCARYRL